VGTYKSSQHELRQELRHGLLNIALKLGMGNSKDGAPYAWMVDTRELVLTQPYLQIVAKMLWDRLKKYRPEAVGGMTLAANPITAAVLCEAHSEGWALKGFLIRRHRKNDGLKKLVEGPKISPGTRIVLVDDMVNSGETQKQAIRALAPFRPSILAVGTILNAEASGDLTLREHDLPLESLFTLRELGILSSKPSSVSAARIVWKWGPLNGGDHSAPNSRPFVTQHRVVVGSDRGFVVCLSIDGRELWRFATRGCRNGVHSSPTVRNDRVWVGAYDGFVYCRSLTDGKPIWERRIGQWVGSSPVVDSSGKCLYIGAEFANRQGSLVALSAETGELLWERKFPHYVHSTPCIDATSGTVLVGCNDGNCYSVDARRGQVRWRFHTAAEVKAGPAIDEAGTCYCCSFDGSIYAVNAASGKKLWSKRVGRRAYFRPLLSGSFVLAAGSSGRILSIDRATGNILWCATAGGGIVGGAAVTNDGKIIAGSQDGSVYLFDGNRGETIWTARTGGPITAEPGIHDGLVVLPSRDGFLYCIKLR